MDIMLMGLTDEALVGEPISTDMGRLRGGRESVLARDGTALLGDALCGLVDGDIDGESISRSLSAWPVSNGGVSWGCWRSCDTPNFLASRELAICASSCS